MEPAKRRVGTFTLGICLVIMGILFLVHLFVPKIISYLLIFHCWPIIFILLGCEILVSSLKWPDQHFQYDFAAILIILLLVCFAMGMAGMEWLLTHDPKGTWICLD